MDLQNYLIKLPEQSQENSEKTQENNNQGEVINQPLNSDLNAQKSLLNNIQEKKDFLKNQNLNEEENFSNDYKQTGIKYLDEKIANDNLTAMDAYIARKYLGVDFNNINLKAKVNANLKTTNQNAINNSLTELSNGIDITTKAIEKSQENTGALAGFNRMLNDKTGGLWSLDDKEQEFKVLNDGVIYAHANAAKTGGKTSNLDVENARNIVGAGYSNKKDLLGKYIGSIKVQSAKLGNEISKALDLGINVDDRYLQKYENLLKGIEYFENNDKNKTDYQTFINLITGKNQSQENTTQKIEKFTPRKEKMEENKASLNYYDKYAQNNYISSEPLQIATESSFSKYFKHLGNKWQNENKQQKTKEQSDAFKNAFGKNA
ncbi:MULTISPECIES: hypothetical protein [unclassified Campylobacter]|uniref:hypothetical protein n=1 Tax=unclassified Campylobacter TaxID=2593542 RepID=UPI001237EB87|nr:MULTISPECIES: hypothetical protein [unclassified Campylobacter]KAA6225926.1 hypothetical protein FMM57_06895 [Campylobacter sp. LR286c]KAA6228186.1 hypothetical protein FMM54_01165 [Campylobacter sp. LR185c]KAA8603353.1 hypothetical protein CGP82_07840 [Campylobacter sp. LR185c]